MKSSLMILIFFLLLISIAYSAVVEVGITETLEGNISSLNYDSSSNIVKFSVEFYNTGSIPYKARIKTEVFNESEMIFSGWGQETEFMSGDKKVSYIYWYASNIGDYSAKLKVYFGNDIKEYKNFDIIVKGHKEPEDNFEIRDLRTYDDYIVFDLYSKKYAENIVVIPKGYTPGWIFEQAVIDAIPKARSKLVVLKYQPTIWRPSNISLEIVSNKGMYHTEERVEMSKGEDLIGLLLYVMDSLRIAFFK
ncbi:MAG: hypothetical protein ABIE55_02055 [Candidatus Aenigmatarchaeota archaeon]